MPVIPESEWQKKFNKTSSQDTKETWQNKFKKPSWQQDTRTWKEKFTGSTEYFYKPINKTYYIKQVAVTPLDDINAIGASYFIEGSILLQYDGSLSVFAKAMTPASSYEVTTIWDATAEIIVNKDVIFKKAFKINKEPYLERDNNYVKLGNVDFKLPLPKFHDQVTLVVRGGYTLIVPSLGNAFVTPTPAKTYKKFPLEITKLEISKDRFDKIFNKLKSIK